MFDAIIGISVNPEIYAVFDGDNRGQAKITATALKCVLSGTSGDVSVALRKLGNNPLLLGAIGPEMSDPFTILLRSLLQGSDICHELLPIRERTAAASLHIALNQAGSDPRIIGIKPPLMQSALEPSLARIRELTSRHQGWLIGTGVLPEEVTVIETVFTGGKGRRILNPRQGLMKHRVLAESLLRQTDVLVCNDLEFAAFFSDRFQLDEQLLAIHDLGVSLVAVTMNGHGACLSYRGEKTYVPAHQAGNCVSEVGAGDWWLAALIHHFANHKVYSVEALKKDLVEEAGKFAAVVAGIKVTMPGASVGPGLSEVRKALAH